MHICRVVIRNFKNFRLLDTPISPGITCIVGENNTGKSNLLFAVRLVLDWGWSAQRRRLGQEDFSVGVDYRKANQILVSVEVADFKADENEEGLLQGYQIADDRYAYDQAHG